MSVDPTVVRKNTVRTEKTTGSDLSGLRQPHRGTKSVVCEPTVCSPVDAMQVVHAAFQCASGNGYPGLFEKLLVGPYVDMASIRIVIHGADISDG